MGLLTLGGRPLDWGEDAMINAIPHILEHGITQLLILYERRKNDNNYPFLWGEEIEGTLCVLDTDGTGDEEKRKSARLCLRAKEFLDHLQGDSNANWMPEYASYMVENTPKRPYSADTLEDLAYVLENMQGRYDALARASRLLHDPAQNGNTRIAAVTLVSFPLLGVAGNFIDKGEHLKPMGQYAMSLFIPDECTNMTHPRFSYLTRNIRLRRGRKVCIQIPMFMDENTSKNTVDHKYSIDYHPNNKFIDCSPEVDKAKHMKAFSSSEEDDDDDEENGAAAAKSKSPSKATKSTSAGAAATAAAAASSTTTTLSHTTFQDHFRHLFTPSSHYYYAQYTNLDEEREQFVRERFNACPCPTLVREHACVYMDSMCFGMGLSCLQVTMQWKNMSECRHMYDQLVPIAPLFLALTSATPFQKGILVESDVRWITISSSVDDRQRGEVPRIVKSRYDNVSMYISDRTKSLEHYNDEHVEVNEQVLRRIKEAGIDDRLATHFAHLFIRDPLVVFDQLIKVADAETMVHFENIQSTNWQSLRFKPPPADTTSIGWRCEFRTMEIQMSPLENAAFSVFTVLLSRAIHKYNLFTLLPMSLVSMNMGAAHMRDPVNTQQFWWRTNNCAFTDAEPNPATDFARMTLDEIFNGCPRFEGFVPLVRRYIRETHGGEDSNPRVEAFIELISRRASGKLKTTANFLREFVLKHPTYKKDSRLTKEIAHDIVELAEKLTRGDTAVEDFIPRDLLQMANRRRARE